MAGKREFFDRQAKDQAEFERIRAYIENNPVKAEFVKILEQYL